MPYTGTRFFFRTDAGEGTNNKRLMDAMVNAINQTTRANFGTDTAARYLPLRPLVTTGPTPAFTPDNTADDFGWTFLKSDLNVAGASRIVPAGNWIVHFRLRSGGSDTLAAAGTYRAHARIFHRSAAGAYTFIAFGEVNIPSASVDGVLSFEINVPVAMPQIVFATDETIYIEMWARGRGIGVTGQIITLELQNTTTVASNVYVDLPSPGLSSLFLKDISAIATGIALQTLWQIRKIFTATSPGLATIVRRLTLARIINATSPGIVTLVKRITKRITATTTGIATRNIRFIHLISATSTGIASIRKQMFRVMTMTATGVASMVRALTAKRTISATSTGVSFFNRALIFGRRITTVAGSIVRIRADLPIERIPRGEGGTVINVIKKIINVFDD